MKFSRRYIQDMFRERSWPFFFSGDLNTNLVFVRKSNEFTNRFDDELRIYFKENDSWVEIVLPWSTKAGVFGGRTGIYDPVTYNGVTGIAVLKEGFYEGAYELHDYKANWLSYPFLLQVGELDIYRDNTRDTEINREVVQRVGRDAQIHIHRAGRIGYFDKGVFRYSIGCLVAPTPYLDILLQVCRQSARIWGNKFSIALIEDC